MNQNYKRGKQKIMDLRELREEITEVIEDCRMYGIDKKCTVYFVCYEDEYHYSGYSINSEKISYLDEKRIKSDLFNLLVELIELDYQLNNVNFTRKMIIARAIWNVKGVSLKKLSEQSGVPLRTLENWNNGIREPFVENLLKYVANLKLPTAPITTALNNGI